MIVRGTAKWASVFDVNEMSGKYQVDICNLDKETIKTLEKVGLSVKKGEGNKEDQGMYITAKASKYRPKVVDNLGTPMDGTVLIGNGSKIKASINPFDWTFKGKSGKSANLNSLMVLQLEAYAGAGGDILEPEELDDIPFDVEDEEL